MVENVIVGRRRHGAEIEETKNDLLACIIVAEHRALLYVAILAFEDSLARSRAKSAPRTEEGRPLSEKGRVEA